MRACVASHAISFAGKLISTIWVPVGARAGAIVNCAALDAPPFGLGFTTVTLTVAPAALLTTSDAGTCAVSCVLPRNVVVSAVPFHSITEPVTKFDPVAVSVNAGLPAGIVVGEIEASTGI